MAKVSDNHGTVIQSVQNYGIRKIFQYIDANPVKRIPKLLKWIEKQDDSQQVKNQLNTISDVLKDKESNWYQLAVKLFTEIDPEIRKTVFENLLINATINWKYTQTELIDEHECNIPWAILLDPTSACNLRCKGCWAADYGNRMNLSFSLWDSIIQQAREMGIRMFIYSGGEPLVRKKDIIAMCEKYDDCIFLSFTNGTLIDEEFADEMLRVKNFVPAISIEGFSTETDARRGEGCYNAVIKAMKILKEKQLLFGISCCYTKDNTTVVGSDAFLDEMVERGAAFAWFFTYMPIGVDAVTELLVTPEQREYMYRQLRNFRKTKPIFTLDFWNDGEFVNGCIAGGRYYLHINANGDIEPCAFIHYSDSNIKEKTILEACKSPLFKQYYSNQPFNENHLRPCPLLDNPEYLAKMVEESGAKSTDMQHPENIHSLCAKCKHTSEKWAETANELWCKNNLKQRISYSIKNENAQH